MIQNMTLASVAITSTCNMSKNVHNTWLHMLSKNIVDLLDTIVDDLAKAIIQIF